MDRGAMEKKVRVLVVDDSALMRKKISEMINADEHCEVIATARNGEEAVLSAAALRPDVITLDIELPKMDGLTALNIIMSQSPTPVIVLTGYTQFAGETTVKCLERGAVDFVLKPGGSVSLEITKIQQDLLAKIKTAAHAKVHSARRPSSLESPARHARKTAAHALVAEQVVVIATSTGGPRALAELLPQIAPEIDAALIVIQHMPEGFTRSMAERLNAGSPMLIKEAEDGDLLLRGRCLIAPGGSQLTFHADEQQGIVARIVRERSERNLAPCADVTLQSLATMFGSRCLGVVLTGMGDDGTAGLRAIKDHGGRTLAEDASTCVVYGMPKAAKELGGVEKELPLTRIADEILKLCRSDTKY